MGHQGFHIRIKRRDIGSDVGQTKEDAVILKGMMRPSHNAIAVTAAVSHEHNRQAMKADVVADLFERPGIKKSACYKPRGANRL